ncbi:lipopolysaccharide biosynthesis protein [Gelidibacter pelagius]|uniref:Oligosaccharide flippase family protein n=1 Tax=Gelidibacter pelagius TaxID=2819985 RepID=A0ABS3SM15_9FLAO|nr:oligosaccharide flippase family protein [Gelidibacter pelagius]MBO3096748.1 oligosaccharide flippase family protein [Gelidibacter pelagius]
MKEHILKILNTLGVKSARTKNIVKHISISFFYKAGAVLANFLLVPLTINFLDTENYGVWLIISSFIAWFSFFDIGLGNGLRNKLTEAKTNGDLKLARGYISSAYYTIAGVSLFMFCVFVFLNYFIDWASVFNTSEAFNTDLNLLMLLVFGFFCIQLVVGLVTNIYLADQSHSIQVKIHFSTQVVSLFTIWILTETSHSSLLIFGAIFAALPVIILLALNLLAFSNKFKELKPSLSLWSKSHLKDIMGVGFDFFIIQIAGIVIFSTDNFIISKLFSPEEVVPYNIAFKYFSILTIVFSIVVAPYWSSFTEAYVKKEYEWIKVSVNNIMRVWLLIPIVVVIMLLLSDWFYNIWVGDKVLVPFMLSVSMAVFVMSFTFNNIFVFFINGTGKIKVQLIVSIFMAIINIPLSIFMAKSLNMGVKGVIIATILSYLPGLILMPLQYNKIINNRARGIWNK